MQNFKKEDSLGSRNEEEISNYLNLINSWENQYLALIKDILENGDDRTDRTGVGTRAVFGKQLDIDLKAGFPAVTTKKLAFKAMTSELLWFLEGSGDERRLAEILHGERDTEKTTIWTDNANADYWKPHANFDGDLGRVYGVQWRSWRKYTQVSNGNLSLESEPHFIQDTHVDQLAELVYKLKHNPTDRRMIISAWNPGELDQMALPPCHMLAQFFVRNKNQEEINQTYLKYRNELSDMDKLNLDASFNDKPKTLELLKNLGLNTKMLSCQMYQRSVDTMLGLPFNVASYALLTHMLAQVSGMEVDRLVMTLGDVHIYNNHIEGAKEQLTRDPLAPPELSINPKVKNIEDFKMDDFKLINYNHYSSIKLDMAV